MKTFWKYDKIYHNVKKGVGNILLPEFMKYPKIKDLYILIEEHLLDIIYNNNIYTYPKTESYRMSIKEKRELLKTIDNPLIDIYIKNRILKEYLLPSINYVLFSELEKLNSKEDIESETLKEEYKPSNILIEIEKRFTKDKILAQLIESKYTIKELINQYFSKSFRSEFYSFLCHYVFIHKIDISEFTLVKEVILYIGIDELLKEFPYEDYIEDLQKIASISEIRAKNEIETHIRSFAKTKELEILLRPIIENHIDLTGEYISFSKTELKELTIDVSDFIEKLSSYGLTLITNKTRKGKQKSEYERKYKDSLLSPLYNDENYLLNLLNDIYLSIDRTLKMGKYYDNDEIKERLKLLLNRAFQIELQDYNEATGFDGVFLKDLEKFDACIHECLFYGIKWTITHTYTTTEIQNELEKMIPKNPKDLYPLTRMKSKEKGYRKIIIEVGGTNSGKTYNAIQALAKAKTGCYAGPLRLLALEIQNTLTEKYGVKTSLLTGVESEIIEGSTHISCTVEKVDVSREYDVVVLDEFQMIGDKDRGFAYSRVLLGIQAKEIYVCTAPEALNLLLKIIKDLDDEYEIVKHERNTPLYPIKHNVNFPKELEPGTAVVCFSKKKVLQMAAMLKSKGYDVNILYGSLPYQVRHAQLNSFISAFEMDEESGEYKAKTKKVLCCTDCISYGMNIPLKTVLLTEVTKFSGQRITEVGSSLGKQICGRAGRYGYYPYGNYGSVKNWELVKQWVEGPTPEVEKAYIGFPDEMVLNLPFQLDEILKVWKNMELDSYLYLKMDIERYLTLYNQLDFLTPEEKKDKFTILKLLFIPFDEKNEELLELWKHYISSYFHDGEIYFGESVSDENDLTELETYYKKLDLFYSFCRNLNLFKNELNWIEPEREEISDKINTLLIEDIVRLGEKRCRVCGKKLSPTSNYNLCQKCFKKSRNRIWY